MTDELVADVVVVGAGPAGLTLANLLQRADISVVVMEKYSREGLLGRARAGILEARTVELMEHMGIASRLLMESREHVRCEFRSKGESFLLDVPMYTGGRTHRVYPQQEVVRDLLEAYEKAGGEIHFDSRAVDLVHHEEHSTVVTDDGARAKGRVIAAADGTYGLGRQALQGEITDYEMDYEFRWLTLLAAVPPSADWTIYGQHETGFAGHLLRTDSITRFHLQVGMDDSIDEWTDARIWEALRTRLAKPGWILNEGPVLSKNMLDMRSRVSEPMVAGRVALLGDAAHIISPAGGKGMYLAMADAFELSRRIPAFIETGDLAEIQEYSRARLPDVWRAQEFSHGLLHTIHAYGSDSPDAAFRQKLQESRLWQLQNLGPYVENFADAFVGPELGTHPIRHGGVVGAARTQPETQNAK